MLQKGEKGGTPPLIENVYYVLGPHIRYISEGKRDKRAPLPHQLPPEMPSESLEVKLPHDETLGHHPSPRPHLRAVKSKSHSVSKRGV